MDAPARLGYRRMQGENMKKLTSLCLILLACASAVQAAPKPAPAPAPSCDRECLRGMIHAVEAFIRILPLALAKGGWD